MVRTWGKRGRVHHDRLGKGAITVLAENSEPDTEAVLAGQAEAASSARQSRVEDHLGALFDAFDSLADTVNDAGAIGTSDVWEADRNSGYAVENKQIEMVEGGALQPYSDLSRTRFGLRTITEDELVGSTVLLEVESFHTNLP
jgi:hypothetical protein